MEEITVMHTDTDLVYKVFVTADNAEVPDTEPPASDIDPLAHTINGVESDTKNALIYNSLPKKIWSFEDTIKLINFIKTHFEDLNHPKHRKKFWRVVSSELSGEQTFASPAECHKKWQNLLRTYKNCKTNKLNSGKGPTKFQFFEQLDCFLGSEPKSSAPHTIDVQTVEPEDGAIDSDTQNSSSDNSFEKKTWSVNDTFKLINCVENRYADLHDPIKRRIFWTLVSKELSNLQINSTSAECQKKWHNLIRTYKVCKDNLKKSGKGPSRFPFFEKLDTILESQANIFDSQTVETKTEPDDEASDEDMPDEHGSHRYVSVEEQIYWRQKTIYLKNKENDRRAKLRWQKEITERRLELETRKIAALEELARQNRK